MRKSFIDPIVVAGALSTRQAQPAVVQLRHIDHAGFEMRLQAWDDRYSRPTPETVGYLVIERGSYILGNGSRVEAGSVQAGSTHGLTQIRFGERFSTVPVVLTSIVSGHEAEVVSARPTMIHQGGFQYRLQGPSLYQSMDVSVNLAYVTWESSWQAIDGLTFEVK